MVTSERVQRRIGGLLDQADEPVPSPAKDEGAGVDPETNASPDPSRASARGGAGDRDKAIKLQGEAPAITRDLGMRPLMEHTLAQREILRA